MRGLIGGYHARLFHARRLEPVGSARVPRLRAHADGDPGPSEVELAGLVTSQENACRYCYGSARVRMKMIGFSDEMVDRIERNVQLVEAEPRERELVHFCRNLARSKPRPAGRRARRCARSASARCRPRSWRTWSRWSVSATASRPCWRCRPRSRWRQMSNRRQGDLEQAVGLAARARAADDHAPRPTTRRRPSRAPSAASCARSRGSPAAATLEGTLEQRVLVRSAAAAHAEPDLRGHRPHARVPALRDRRRRPPRSRWVLARRARRGARDPGIAAPHRHGGAADPVGARHGVDAGAAGPHPGAHPPVAGGAGAGGAGRGGRGPRRWPTAACG